MPHINCPTFYFKRKNDLIESASYSTVTLWLYHPSLQKAINTTNNTEHIAATNNEALVYMQDDWVPCSVDGVIIDSTRQEELDNIHYTQQSRKMAGGDKYEATPQEPSNVAPKRVVTENTHYLQLTEEDIENKRILLTEQIISEIISATSN